MYEDVNRSAERHPSAGTSSYQTKVGCAPGQPTAVINPHRTPIASAAAAQPLADPGAADQLNQLLQRVKDSAGRRLPHDQEGHEEEGQQCRSDSAQEAAIRVED